MVKEKKKYDESSDVEEFIDNSSDRFLVLHNDEINTFDFVIEALIDVCDHDQVQAEQCTLIVHYKGKCDVKKGKYYSLKPLRSKLIDKGLTATID